MSLQSRARCSGPVCVGTMLEEGAGPDDESRLVNVDVNDVQILCQYE